jgi:hypothetical protein
VLWFGAVGLPVTVANLVGFTLFALLLVEGAGYWLAKLRQLTVPGTALPGARGFAIARVANLPVLTGGLLFTSWAVTADPGAGSWPGLAFASMAVLEQVNYFHTQLMYDTAEDLRYLRAHGLRRAHLARDLALTRRERVTRPTDISCVSTSPPRPTPPSHVERSPSVRSHSAP